MHVYGLDGHERAEAFRGAQSELRDDPRVDEPIVGVDQHAAIAGPLAPARDLRDALRVWNLMRILGLRAGGEELQPGAHLAPGSSR